MDEQALLDWKHAVIEHEGFSLYLKGYEFSLDEYLKMLAPLQQPCCFH